MSSTIGNAIIAKTLLNAQTANIKFDTTIKPSSIAIGDMFGIKEILHKDDYTDAIDNKSSEIDTGESGWDFWSRVYDDPELRAQMIDRFQNAPTVSEMLSSEKLVRAQLIFLNVPRIGAASQQVIRTLIEDECGKNIAIFDASISNRKWVVRFYRCEDALHVMRVLNGYRFRNRFLSIRYENIIPCKSFETEKSSMQMDYDSIIGPSLVERSHVAPVIDNKLWSATEHADLEQFKNGLMQLLETTDKINPGICIDDPRIIHVKNFDSLLIKTMSHQWPIGLFRMCAPEPYPRVSVESWEPMSPALIHTKYHLVDYTCALLRHFGAQHVDVDLPWRMLAALLPSGYDWPQQPAALMKLVASLSPKLEIFDGTLFLLNDVRHRRALAHKLTCLPH